MDASRIAIALKLCALIAAALATVIPALEVSATTASVAVESGTANVGEEVSVDLQALGVAEPGLGAWTIDITYDPSVVSLAGCQPHQESVCRPEFGPSTDRIVGASRTGLAGDTALATMAYRCEAEGVSPLELDVSVFTDNVIGRDTDYTVENGAITCVEPAEPTATRETAEPTATQQPAPTATAAPVLPATGGGRGSSQTGLIWLMAALGGAGLAVLAAASALRLRKRLG